MGGRLPGGTRTAAAALVIAALSASLGMLVHWQAPGIDRYARDRVMRARGPLPAPDDIAIVAIDEASLSRFGRFPWPRSIMARALAIIAAAQPKAIALDVLYTDASTPEHDAELARAIGGAGNVVLAAQLADPRAAGGPVSWLLPLPGLARAAAAVGHVNVLTESEGVARGLLVRAVDDTGRPLRAMAIETVRIGDGTSEQAVTETPRAMLVGRRMIPVETEKPAIVVAQARGEKDAARWLRPGRMTIEYIGPLGSFAPTTYSLADVVDERIPAPRFQRRYVLIGATAASMGDRLSSPFVHDSDMRADQHGALMPGVEVLANAINTILRARYYSETPDWAAFLCAALIAAATLGLLAATQARRVLLDGALAMAGLGVAIVAASYLSFAHWLVFPPLVPGMVSFASAGILGLLRRSLITSARLDGAIAEIARAGNLLVPAADPSGAAESIARLTDASAVAIFAADGAGHYTLVASYGARVTRRLGGHDPRAADVFALPPGACQTTVQPVEGGVLAIALRPAHIPATDALNVSAAIAAACVANQPPGGQTFGFWPRGLEEKARLLGVLNERFIERTRFADLALRSVEDGLVIAGPDGRIAFANSRAAAILETAEGALAGRNLLERLAEYDATLLPREVLSRLLLDRVSLEREITVGGPRPRQYILRLAPVTSGAYAGGVVLGMVASLSDITRQKQLQQTKNDVISLVSHEMRTPLTAIQGMSELLAQYDVDQERRRELNLAINDEVKRLTRMITEYLDITRLESGASVLRPVPVRVEMIVERVLLLLEPLAEKEGLCLARRFAPELPALLADADLLARAVNNLVSNAVKYSPPGRQVTTSVYAAGGNMHIEVADHGYGIPAADLDRVFEKFYRVPRLEDAGVAGTGLGLALVREIAELHGGTVTVKSEVNAGSVFTLTVPLEGAAGKRQEG